MIKPLPPSNESGSPDRGDGDSLVKLLTQKLVGQPEAMKFIAPYVEMYQAGLAPANRPAGVFLLLGPTGTGKTRTVEALAEILHGSEKKVIKIDCGEFQMEHEVAKLIGAPPGYRGHQETESVLTQQRLQAATTAKSDLAIVLFDEIEKAAPSVTRLLIGILDKAILRLGDNTEVNFEKTLVFFTSNLGAREMMKEVQPGVGFREAQPVPDWSALKGKLQSIALAAVRKMYSPEFVNRIDAVITYQPLDDESFAVILDQQISELQNHVNNRLGNRGFDIAVPLETRQYLLRKGTSLEFGARELKRTVHRFLTQPLATLVIQGKVKPGSCVVVGASKDAESLEFQVEEGEAPRPCKRIPVILIADDNQALVQLLAERILSKTEWRVFAAFSAERAIELAAASPPDVSLLDFLLPDGNGVQLGVDLRLRFPEAQVLIMTGAYLPPEEEAVCREYGFEVMRKPFLVDHIVNAISKRLGDLSQTSA